MVCTTLAACLMFAASFQANTFGYGELSCNKNGKLVRCVKGNRTASGETFDPKRATVAIWLPRNVKLEPQWIYVRLGEDGECTKLWLNDRKGHKGFDLTPGALRALGVKPSKSWSGRLHVCNATAVASSSKKPE